MTKQQLLALLDALGEFESWMDDRPLQLALVDALTIVCLAVHAEAAELANEER